jgi:hypothetical protein
MVTCGPAPRRPTTPGGHCVPRDHGAFVLLQREHLELKKHCAGLEELIHTYACVINELALETRH